LQREQKLGFGIGVAY